MQKIKKFKISLRPASVRKNFKALSGDREVSSESEQMIAQEYNRIQEWLSPAAVFDTFRHDESWPPFLSGQTSDLEPAAASAWVATVGLPIEEEISRCLDQNNNLRSWVLSALAEEAANAAALFVSRLIAEEAKKEGCELSESQGLSGVETTRSVLASLSGERIGVRLEGGILRPRFTDVSSVFWIPQMTKKRRLLLADKPSFSDKAN